MGMRILPTLNQADLGNEQNFQILLNISLQFPRQITSLSQPNLYTVPPVSILGLENCQSFFSHNSPWMYVRCAAMRGAPQCAARTSLIGTTLAKPSKQLRNITYRQLFNIHTILSCLFIKCLFIAINNFTNKINTCTSTCSCR